MSPAEIQQIAPEHATVDPITAAAMTDRGQHAIYRAIRAGEIPVVRCGRRIRVPTSYILAELGLAPAKLKAGRR